MRVQIIDFKVLRPKWAYQSHHYSHNSSVNANEKEKREEAGDVGWRQVSKYFLNASEQLQI